VGKLKDFPRNFNFHFVIVVNIKLVFLLGMSDISRATIKAVMSLNAVINVMFFYDFIYFKVDRDSVASGHSHAQPSQRLAKSKRSQSHS
jgi:hypothetical protein